VKPSVVAGSTQATAIALPLAVVDPTAPETLNGGMEVPVPARGLPRWYVVTLPAGEKRTLSVEVSYKGPAKSVQIELVDPSGQVFAHANERFETYGIYSRSGSRSAWLDEAHGTYFVRVTAHDGAEDYLLNISSTVVTPAPPNWPLCNPFVFDAANPRCAAIDPCDPNNPVDTNPACCTVLCLRGTCPGKLSPADPEGLYAWFDVGAEYGITKWYQGSAELPLAGGGRARGSLLVVDVERKRSKVVLGKTVDLSRLAGTFARLDVPALCAHE
jgi:hypothetical protein